MIPVPTELTHQTKWTMGGERREGQVTRQEESDIQLETGGDGPRDAKYSHRMSSAHGKGKPPKGLQ